MTSEQYEKEIARLSRRLNLLKLARDGSADIELVPVKRHWVKGHWIGKHNRTIIRRRK